MSALQELFMITEGSSQWFRTSGDQPMTYMGNVYIPTPMSRSELESKDQLSRANIELNFGMDDTMARRWLNSIIDTVVTLSIFSVEAETGNVGLIWKGRMTAVKPTMSQIKLVWESVFTSLRRPGLRRTYQRNCPHMLYGRGCFVNKELYAVTGTVIAISSTKVNVNVSTASGHVDGWYTGGILKSPDGIMRFITNHVGVGLKLIRPIDTLLAGQTVTLYPGCDRTRQTCQDKFNNLNNNGSTPFIPIKNPYGGLSFI